jgi:hypothetical protein
MTPDETRSWLDEELAIYPERASGHELQRYLVHRTVRLASADPESLTAALVGWIRLREEPRSMLAVEICAAHHLHDARGEIEELLDAVRAGEAFLPHYERAIAAALQQL